MLVVPRHEVADELVVRHVFNVVHVSLKFVFLKASSRMFLLIMSALNHALMRARFEASHVFVGESRTCCCHPSTLRESSLCIEAEAVCFLKVVGSIPVQPHAVVVGSISYMGGISTPGGLQSLTAMSIFLCHGSCGSVVLNFVRACEFRCVEDFFGIVSP